MRPLFRAASILTILLSGGCSDDPPLEASGGAKNTPLYHEDIAPVIYQHCLPCHEPGNVAPFALTDYEQTKAHALAIKEATRAREMPPWPAGNSGACNTYRDARWLSEVEIDTLANWYESGMLEGQAADPPARSDTGRLEDVARTLTIAEPYTPDASVADDYRCFIVDPKFATDTHITGYHVKPGEPRVVHHVILYSLDSAKAEQKAEALDTAEAGPGYTCYGGSRVLTSRFIAAWAPGTAGTQFPADSGVVMKAGRKAIIQVHYNLDNGAFPDQTSIDVQAAEAVAYPATILMLADLQLEIPPGQKSVIEEATMVNPATDAVRIWGSFPHMHELGVSLRATADDTCLVDVPKWDFEWQQMYFYEEPVVVKPSATLKISCEFNSEARQTTTSWGDGTKDEMCLNFLYVTK